VPRIGRSLFGLTRQRSYNSIHRAFVPLAVGTRLGSYEVVSAIGAGGMGEVYRAHDLKLGRSVALKVLPAAFAADSDRLVRFEREAQLLASLNHPHIAAIYGLEEATPVRALVLELVDGDTLADRLARESGASAPALPIEEAISIGRQIADALDAAHEQGIVHRDLKPSNIKVRADGTVKVLDFGLAKLAVPVSPTAIGSTVTAPPMQTEVGMILGTPAYMAPEQARGLPADKRSDMWAFGCILYEMLTGRRLFDGEHSSDTIALVLTKDPDWRALPITLPSAIRTLLRRCLERDSHRRLGDAATARFVLEEAGALSPARDATDVATSEHGRRRWWMRTASVAAGALVVGASSAALFMWMRTPPDEPRVVRTNRRATDDNEDQSSTADWRDSGWLAAALHGSGAQPRHHAARSRSNPCGRAAHDYIRLGCRRRGLAKRPVARVRIGCLGPDGSLCHVVSGHRRESPAGVDDRGQFGSMVSRWQEPVLRRSEWRVDECRGPSLRRGVAVWYADQSGAVVGLARWILVRDVRCRT